MRRNGWDGDWPPRSKPRQPADGIKAQSQRGAFASGPWAKRWIAVLEAFQLGTRLARGRSYARSGQVIAIALEVDGVRAQVQGSRPKPYTVAIRLRQLSASEWGAVGSAISADVRLCAALLAGEMPADIETAFNAAGTSLFPTTTKEMKTTCSCPDSSNPCKHVAAVFYLVGEEFDRDPFLLFVVRGLERDAIHDLIAEKRESTPVAARTTKPKPKPVPARISADAFWGENSVVPAQTMNPINAQSSDEPAVLKRAGKFPFWRGDNALADEIAPIYNDATAFALNWLADRAEKLR